MVSTGTGQQQAPQPPVDLNGVVLAFDAAVLADQQLLARAGFYGPTAPNGYTDAVHIRAVRKAREALGISGPDTSIDPVLRARLQHAVPTVLEPDPVFPREGPRIAQAQIDLRDLGLYSGGTNGIPNAEFDAALRAFQIREQLPSYPRSATPILDDMTLARVQLRAAEAKSRGTTPAPATPAPAPDPAGVLATQQLLARSGFYDRIPNGVVDDFYYDAIRRARQEQGLPEGRELREAREPLEQRLAAAQSGLRDLGLYAGPVDGIPSATLDTAVRAFQARENLPSSASPTPVVDEVTRARLELRVTEAKSRGAAPATPPPAGGVMMPVATPIPMSVPMGMAPMGAAPAPTSQPALSPVVVGVVGLLAGVTLAALYFRSQP